jgi:alpha-mannosidase
MSAESCYRPVHALPSKNPRLIRSIAVDRLANFTSSEGFSDVNLYSQLYKRKSDSKENVKLNVYSVPHLKRISFKEAVRGHFKPTKKEETFGPSWVSNLAFNTTIRLSCKITRMELR